MVSAQHQLRASNKLRYLDYILQQPSDHYTSRALQQQCALDARGYGWLHALRVQLEKRQVALPHTLNQTSAQVASKALTTAMEATYRLEVTESPKLDLLRERVAFTAQGPRTPPTFAFRAYLRIPDGALRKAVTGILRSDHILAVEVLRRHSGGLDPVPRADRLCRLCGAGVEEPLHALFACTARQELLDSRDTMWSECTVAERGVVAREGDATRSQRARGNVVAVADARSMTPVQRLYALLDMQHTCTAMARHIVRVLSVYASVPIRDPRVEVG